MVLLHKSKHSFPYDFRSVSCAYFNRYPNPYSEHVLSIDTLDRHVDSTGRLHTTRLLRKTGQLPSWARHLLGKISESWIIEISVVDPRKRFMQTFTRNLDHTRVMRIEEFTTYSYNDSDKSTLAVSHVRFASAFRLGTIRDRIESWCQRKFDDSVRNSRQGMAFVIAQWEVKTRESQL